LLEMRREQSAGSWALREITLRVDQISTVAWGRGSCSWLLLANAKS